MYLVLILLAAASRLLPHPLNFAPIGALGLFAGAYSERRIAWLAPIAALLASDLILGAYSPVIMLGVYGGFAISGVLGSRFLRQERTVARLVGCALVSGTVVFLLSNFACWLVGYPHTAEGLARCYTLALPFYRNTLLGDLFYTSVLFGLFEAARVLSARPQVVQA